MHKKSFISHRYGYRPLRHKIGGDEFKKIKNELESQNKNMSRINSQSVVEIDLLDELYEIDENDIGNKQNYVLKIEDRFIEEIQVRTHLACNLSLLFGS